MPGLFFTPIPPDKDLVRYEAREVVVDLHDKPHLLTRLSLMGPYFPQRSEEAYVAVGKMRSKFVLISEDGQRADAYFERALPPTGTITFGYGKSVDLVVPRPFQATRVMKLDLDRLRRAIPNLHVPD
jgi:hypothetical protein